MDGSYLFSLGVPWAFLGCLKVSLEAPVEHSGGLVGVPGVLLVALRGFIRFWVALGAVSGKFLAPRKEPKTRKTRC